MKHGRTLNLDEAFKRLDLYLPVAFKQTEITGVQNLYKIYAKVGRVLQNQPIEDVTLALAITLGDVVNYWQKKQPLRKQRKAA